MSNSQVKKPKSGGEKKSLAAKKLREKSAEGCFTIDTLFSQQATANNINKASIDIETEIATGQANFVISHEEVSSTAKINNTGNNCSHLPQKVTISKNLLDNYESVENVTEDINYENIHQTVENKALDDLDYFKKPSNKDLEFFLRNHPKQSTTDSLVQKSFFRKDSTKRTWLSFDEKNTSLFCWLCLVYADESANNLFIKGYDIRIERQRKHIHQRVEEHEQSKSHHEAANSFFMRNRNANVSQLLFSNKNSLRLKEVTKNRQIVERVVDVLILIGKFKKFLVVQE